MKETQRLIHRVLRLARAHESVLVLIPVLLGTAYARRMFLTLHWAPFLLCIFGALTLHLGANTIKSYLDFLKVTHPENPAAVTRDMKLPLGPDVLTAGQLQPFQALSAAFVFFAASFLFGVGIWIYQGWFVPFLGGLGFLLAFANEAPPLRLGYRGDFAGEIAMFLAFGLFPVLGAYYAQTGRVDFFANLGVAFPCAIYTSGILYHRRFVDLEKAHEREDRSPVEALGEKKALRLTWLFPGLAYLSILIGAAAGYFPATALLALGSAPIYLYARLLLGSEGNPKEYYEFLAAKTAQAATLTGVVLVVTMLVSWG